MNILFLGTIISDTQRERLMNEGISPQPADIVQKYIIEELSKNKSVKSLDVISSPRIAGFPKVNIKNVDSNSFKINNIKINVVGYRNYGELNFAFREICFRKYVRDWAINNKEKKNLKILIYSLNSTFLKAACDIKKIIIDSQISVIVPDLPVYMNNYSGIKSIAKKINMYSIERLRENINKYVLYSKHMAKYFNIPEKSWIVVEGFIEERKIVIEPNHNAGKRVCVYAGDLNPIYHIGELIKAFQLIETDAELHIYGNPNVFKQYKSLITKENVIYKGLLTPDQVFQVFKNATLLINPRPSDLELTKYSCPSKTFEYMASGTPVLMCKLPGIPDEYFDNMYIFEDETVYGMAKTIEKILKKTDDELMNMGKKAADFLRFNKTAAIQVNRIVDFINTSEE